MQDSFIQAHNAESKAVWDAFNCGDATRHFQWLKDDLGLNDFETGFPVDHGRIRRELGRKSP